MEGRDIICFTWTQSIDPILVRVCMDGCMSIATSAWQLLSKSGGSCLLLNPSHEP